MGHLSKNNTRYANNVRLYDVLLIILKMTKLNKIEKKLKSN